MQASKQTLSTPKADISLEVKKISEQQDSIKVSRNSKGYTWEIKRYYDFNNTKPEAVIKQLETINSELHKKFGHEDD